MSSIDRQTFRAAVAPNHRLNIKLSGSAIGERKLSFNCNNLPKNAGIYSYRFQRDTLAHTCDRNFFKICNLNRTSIEKQHTVDFFFTEVPA